MTRLTSVALATVSVLALTASTALAQAGESVGENIGDLLGGWASSLFTGVVAIISIVFLLSRKFTELAVFLVIAIIVGGFALSPDSAAAAIRGLFQAIVGS
jgi:hypothetical protein